MSYLHIPNLYSDPTILLFREAWALEKIHGTSAHISFAPGLREPHFFAGGAKHANFVALFDVAKLQATYAEMSLEKVTVYGECFAGKEQGMSKTYGTTMAFAAFDVRIGESWLSVPNAVDVVGKFGLEFVPYRKVSTDLTALDFERDRPSEVAARRGITEPRMRKGVVLRPLVELTKNNGERVIAKHKRAEFSERKTVPEVDPTKRQVLEDADKVAEEWVVPMRLEHVLQDVPQPHVIQQTGQVVKEMVEDVVREAGAEIVDSVAVRRAVGAKAAKLFKQFLASKIGQEVAS